MGGVLIIGSGQASRSCFDNTSQLEAFVKSLKNMCCSAPRNRSQSLQSWSSLPHARAAHGREGYLLPLHIAVGAAEWEQGIVVGDLRLHGGGALVHFMFGEDETETVPDLRV